MPEARIQFFDNSGNPCNGCLLYHYEAGTTTPLDLFTTSDVSAGSGVPHAQPIVLSSAGRSPTGSIYLQARSYRFALYTSADVLIWDQDNVSAMPNVSGNLDVTGTSGETLAYGDVVYLSDGSGSNTAGRWYKADADTTYSSSAASLVGLATAAITSGSSGTIRLSGRITGLSGLVAGSSYYISATAASLTATAPSNARFVGAADSTTTFVVQGGGPVTSNVAGPCTGRLTGTTAEPVPSSDVTVVTSIFWTPFGGNECWTYDGSTGWTRQIFSELTISLTGCTASRPYDVFLYNNAGTIATETTAWTNSSTRATNLTLQNGVYVKSGTTTRRYVGTFFCNVAGGQTDDSLAKRYIWNYYNRVPRTLRRVETAVASWNYTTATIRQAFGSAANQVEFVVGVAEINATIDLRVIVSNGAAGTDVAIGIGLDVTNAFTATAAGGAATSAVAGSLMELSCRLDFRPAIGLRTMTWLEWSEAANTTTWYAFNIFSIGAASGLSGTVEG